MKLNNRAEVTATKVVLSIVGIILLLALFYLTIQSIGGFNNLRTEGRNFVGVESVGGIPNGLSFLNYIIGGVPNVVIAEVGDMAAFVVTLVIFIMLALTFGDVLSKFGTYSAWMGWVLGILLAIVAANLKLVIIIAIISFAFISGVGALSVSIGLLFPFVFFIIAHFMVLKPITEYLAGEKEATQMNMAVGQVTGAIKAIRSIGKGLTE